MKTFKLFLLLGLFSAITFSLTSCSDDSEKSSSKTEMTGDHVWKTQTDALQSAKDVAGKLQESLNQQKDKLDDND